MERERYDMPAFERTHLAMAAQRQLRGRLPFTVMPTLRQVSAACGISLRLAPGAEERLRALAAEGVFTAMPCALYRVEDGRAALIRVLS